MERFGAHLWQNTYFLIFFFPFVFKISAISARHLDTVVQEGVLGAQKYIYTLQSLHAHLPLQD